MKYLDFTLYLHSSRNPDGTDSYYVRPVDSTATMLRSSDSNEGIGDDVPTKVDIAKVNDLLGRVKHAMGTRGEFPDDHLFELGRELHNLVLPPRIEELFDQSLERAKAWGFGVRLRLFIEPEELALFPFEFLVRDNAFLALGPDIAIVRLTDLKPIELDLAPSDILRVLVVVSNPEHPLLPKLPNLRNELESIQQNLQRLGNAVSLKMCSDPSPSLLQDLCRNRFDDGGATGYHVIVFLGHAHAHDPDQPANLVLDDGRGKAAYMPISALATALDGTDTRLVILNACELTPGRAAHDLASSGIAVIANQFKQPDTDALFWSDAFWRGVANRTPIEDCIREARKVVLQNTKKRPDWGNAVLIMHARGLTGGELLAKQEAIQQKNYVRFLERLYSYDDILTEFA